MAKVIRKPGPAKARLEKLIAEVEEAAHMRARVGILEAKYEKGVPVAYVAEIHENGVPQKNIPARKVFAPTVDRCREQWRELARQGAKAVLQGRIGMKEFLGKLALHAEGEVRRGYTLVKSPPLKKATVEARLRRRKNKKNIGSLDKPLIDSGYLLNSVTSEVSKA